VNQTQILDRKSQPLTWDLVVSESFCNGKLGSIERDYCMSFEFPKIFMELTHPSPTYKSFVKLGHTKTNIVNRCLEKLRAFLVIC